MILPTKPLMIAGENINSALLIGPLQEAEDLINIAQAKNTFEFLQKQAPFMTQEQRNVFVQISKRWNDVSRDLILVQNYVKEEKDAIEIAESETLKQMQVIEKRLLYMTENTPRFRPSLNPVAPEETKKKKKVIVPSIIFVSVPEMESVPKYLKGRITREKLNECIHDFNKAIQEKYKLLKVPTQKLSQEQKQRVWDYKESEMEAVENKIFITEQDMKTSQSVTSFKFDNVGRSMLSILRHLGRIKEHRGGGHTRFIIE